MLHTEAMLIDRQHPADSNPAGKLGTTDLLLIVTADRSLLDTLSTVAGQIECAYVTADCTAVASDLIHARPPTLVVLAVDHAAVDTTEVLQSLSAYAVKAPLLLVGSDETGALSSARQAAASRGIHIIGEISGPVDLPVTARLLSSYIARQPEIPTSEILQALREHELFLVYQPKVSLLPDGLFVRGVEALVRWQHPRRGMLRPREFLDAINNNDLMTELTDFVMDEALRQIALWEGGGLSLDIIVNLSARLVRDTEFPDRLATLLEEHAVPPPRLIFDVHDTCESDNEALVLDVFRRLRVLGVGLSMDNFGTEFSPLDKVYRIPFSELKVDRSLIADLPHEYTAMVLMRHVAELAHDLKMKVCAGGVESRQMFECVRAAGFDFAQGNFFSDALPAADIERLVQNWPSVGPGATDSWRVLKP